MKKTKVAFVCVHNSCRSQIAEALTKKFAGDSIEVYSAGTELKDQINQDAVRLVKEIYAIDMEETQKPKLLDDIPEVDYLITMGCNVVCPILPYTVKKMIGDLRILVEKMIKSLLKQLRRLKVRFIN